MPQDFLHHLALVNHGNHAPGVLADRAAERIGVPDLLDEVAPLFREIAANKTGIFLEPALRCGGFCGEEKALCDRPQPERLAEPIRPSSA